VVRVVFSLALATIVASASSTDLGRTLAFFTANAAAASSMSTVQLNVSTLPSASAVFNIASNMLPGDFQINTFDVVNAGTESVIQQDFTYSFASASTGPGNTCSLLDSTDPPTCSTPVVPSATATTGAALLLLRCTSDPGATTPLACATTDVYVTQIYPAVGAGTQRRITTMGGLVRSAVPGVATSGYSIGIGGTNFTGGQLRIGSPFNAGGPDSVAGADGQSLGLAASRIDHLASVVYLPSQAGATLANQTSVLTFTWTATQRQGGTR
jgi:hypothetical protein